jgi:ligand-binding sensor domain-containing protein
MSVFPVGTVLFFNIVFTMITSCSGQNNVQTANNNSHGFVSDAVIGDTVSEMDKNVWCILQDRHNNYWFGSDGKGVYRYDGKNIVHLNSKHGLCDDRIRQIQEDSAGNIYFTTLNGISKFDGKKFIRLIVAAGNAPGQWRLKPNDLWFRGEGQMKGPYRYDGNVLHSLEFPKHYMEDDYYRQYPNTPINPYDLYYIYKDKKGAMWFGTGALGIYHYDGTSIRSMYEKHLTQTESGGSFCIRSIMEDRKGKFWFCNTKYRYNILPGESTTKGKGFVNYTTEKGIDVAKGLLSNDRLYFQSIVEDSLGDLWMQTYQEGIWRYDGNKTTRYFFHEDATVKVISMYQDKRGGLWLGTDGSGVYKFNGKTFEQFNQSQVR